MRRTKARQARENEPQLVEVPGWGVLMRRAVESEVSKALAKYGFATLAAGYMLWFLTQGLQADVAGIKLEAAGIRQEHVQMGSYLQAICVGVNRGNPEGLWLCQQAGLHNAPKPKP